VLTNFEIVNFRTFSHLRIERLGRVNLIVGRNAVGKTTLLEAIWLYAARMRTEAIYQVLLHREEYANAKGQETREAPLDISAIFHKRMVGPSVERQIMLGPIDDASSQIRLRAILVQRVASPETNQPPFAELSEEQAESAQGDVSPALKVNYGGEELLIHRVGNWWHPQRGSRRMESFPPFIRAGTVDEELVGRWWDAVALRESEERIVSCLRLLVPVERITLVENPVTPYGRSSRAFLVRLTEQRLPQPLKSLGDGVERMFRTVLALELARRSIEDIQGESFPSNDVWQPSSQNVLLVDEVESGIHYSALGDYWKMIFKLARELDVQVFATTHSWDCIQGFQEAAVPEGETEGVLIRLESGRGKFRAFTFAGNELAIVARDQIEVR
jgi:hypothetical protein